MNTDEEHYDAISLVVSSAPTLESINYCRCNTVDIAQLSRTEYQFSNFHNEIDALTRTTLGASSDLLNFLRENGKCGYRARSTKFPFGYYIDYNDEEQKKKAFKYCNEHY